MDNNFISKKDLSLFTSGSRFSLAPVFLQSGMEKTIATFDLFVRELPETRNYLVFAGLEQVADYLLNLRLTADQLSWLKKSFDFSPETMKYFKDFRFSGDMWAMPEGSIFFPNEPVIRITAPIIEAQIIEMFLINTVYLQTILASKIERFTRAARGKQVAVGFNRSYGLDAAVKSARINEIFGNTNSLAFYHYKNKSHVFSAGTFHYLIMAFENESEAFKSYLKIMKGKGYVLVDTYGTMHGIKNFIKVTKELEKSGIRPVGIQLDSGDLYKLSCTARKMLDKAGLNYVKIFAMGNLDEKKVDKLERQNAPIDVYAGVTELLTPTDAPTIELVYKLSELQKGNLVLPKMKTSTKKVSLPGRKQVYRITKKGKYGRDVIGLTDEKIQGEKLLMPVIKMGKAVYKFPKLEKIREYYKKEKEKFSENLFSFYQSAKFPVLTSKNLNKLIKETKNKIFKIHHDIDI